MRERRKRLRAVLSISRVPLYPRRITLRADNRSACYQAGQLRRAPLARPSLLRRKPIRRASEHRKILPTGAASQHVGRAAGVRLERNAYYKILAAAVGGVCDHKCFHLYGPRAAGSGGPSPIRAYGGVRSLALRHRNGVGAVAFSCDVRRDRQIGRSSELSPGVFRCATLCIALIFFSGRLVSQAGRLLIRR